MPGKLRMLQETREWVCEGHEKELRALGLLPSVPDVVDGEARE